MAKIKVLLVEDEPTLAMIIKDTLDGEEFDIVLAADGEEGLALYKEIKPDIIVTDIMMPKIDGFHPDTAYPQNRQPDTCPLPLRPFCRQRCCRRFRAGRQRLPEKAFRHGGADHPYQSPTE